MSAAAVKRASTAGARESVQSVVDGAVERVRRMIAVEEGAKAATAARWEELGKVASRRGHMPPNPFPRDSG